MARVEVCLSRRRTVRENLISAIADGREPDCVRSRRSAGYRDSSLLLVAMSECLARLHEMPASDEERAR